MKRKPRLVVLPPQHLGHELHVGRCVVVDMVAQGFLDGSMGDSVLTGLPDRKFFYEDLLGTDQVLDFSLLPGMPLPVRPPKGPDEYIQVTSSQLQSVPRFSGFDVINLTGYALPPTHCTFSTTDEMAELGYRVPERFLSEAFSQHARRFKFSAPEELAKAVPARVPHYIVLHHRYGASIDELLKLFANLPLHLWKVVFTSNPQETAQALRGMPNAFFTNDLQLYATALRDERCKLLISEWSGAGQLAQYTLGNQGGIWFYYNHYPDVFNFTATHKIWETNAMLGNYFNCWDFKNISGCDIRHFPDFDALIGAVKVIQAT